jgi:hypothetical protein
MPSKHKSLAFDLPDDPRFKELLLNKIMLGYVDYAKKHMGNRHGVIYARSMLAFFMEIGAYIEKNHCDRETAMKQIKFVFLDDDKPKAAPIEIKGYDKLWRDFEQFRKKAAKIKKWSWGSLNPLDFQRAMKKAFPFCSDDRIVMYQSKKLEPYDIAWDVIAQKYGFDGGGDVVRKYFTRVEKGRKVMHRTEATLRTLQPK